MKKVIQEVVNELRIPEKRKKANLNRLDITKCNVAMSNMAILDKHVAIYAYDLDRLQHLLKENNQASIEEIKRLREEIKNLEKCKGVREYQFVLSYEQRLEEQISDYYKTIQIDLRKELLDLTLPEIYVSQGKTSFNPKMNLAKHIIVPGTTIATSEDDFETTIFPEEKPITSTREARHFYNQVSFKYLEGLTENYSFDLEGKDLGKVRVLKRG